MQVNPSNHSELPRKVGHYFRSNKEEKIFDAIITVVGAAALTALAAFFLLVGNGVKLEPAAFGAAVIGAVIGVITIMHVYNQFKTANV